MEETKEIIKEIICIVGLGYVGLPLAIAFSKHFYVIGIDIDEKRIAELQNSIDTTKSVEKKILQEKIQENRITFTADFSFAKKAQYIIIAVPTPVDDAKKPELSALKNATGLIGKNLSSGAIVIYESTVYPGMTEEVCLPILEKESGLKLGQFGLGYSPERINPGDDAHRIDNVIKIVSGHDKPTLDKVAALYQKIVLAGVYRAPEIKVAEAAKVVENVQRDLNIALMNELALIFHKLNIDTQEVLRAAGTKWNFHQYYPGLVGGHCIGIDPYYLAFQAIEHGYHPKIILSGREVNDYMAQHIAGLTIKELNYAGKILKQCTVLLLGLTFKEDVTDIRNTRAADVMRYLQDFGIHVVACEPHISNETMQERFGIQNLSINDLPCCDAIIIINKHKQFSSLTLGYLKEKTGANILIDIKRLFSRKEAEEKGFVYRAL